MGSNLKMEIKQPDYSMQKHLNLHTKQILPILFILITAFACATGKPQTTKAPAEKVVKETLSDVTLPEKHPCESAEVMDSYSTAKKLLHENDLFNSFNTVNQAIAKSSSKKCNAYLYLIRAYAFLKNGDLDLSLIDFKRVTEAAPQFSEAYYGLGNIYFIKEDFKKSLVEFNKCIFLSPLSELPYRSRGLVWAYGGNYERALSDFNQALKIKPRSVESLSSRGLLYLSRSKSEEAFQDLNQAITLNPSYPLAYCYRGQAWLSLGSFEKARADFMKSLELEPGIITARKGMAEIHYLQKNYESTITDFIKVIMHIPKGPQDRIDISSAYNGLAWLYATCPDPEYREGKTAIKYAEKALEYSPKNPAYIDTLAASYAETGNFKKGIELLESLLAEFEKDLSPSIKQEITEHLAAFKKDMPWREKSINPTK